MGPIRTLAVPNWVTPFPPDTYPIHITPRVEPIPLRAWSWGIPLCNFRIDSICGSLSQIGFIFLIRVYPLPPLPMGRLPLVLLAVDVLLVNPFPTQFTKVGRTRPIAYYTKTPWVAPLGPVLAHIRPSPFFATS